jgi:hypothetical protein
MLHKTLTRFPRLVHIPLLIAFASQSLVSCVTQGTGNLVKTQVMDPGLEARVLKQTGLSGAAVGALTGAAVGMGATLLAGGLTGRQPTSQQLVMAGVVGATAGGIFGWHKGQQKGAAVVATAKDRDNLKQLVQGATQYNAHLASYNASLRREVASAKSGNDKKRLLALNKEASAKLATVNKTLSVRTKSVNNLPPNYRGGYANTLGPLKQEKRELEAAISNIAATERSISL